MQEFPAPAYFISDSHLPLIAQPGQESWMPRMLSFLRKEAVEASSLFLVGDLFDFWFEWRHSVPAAAFPVLAELHNLVQQGVSVVYLGGNHDGHVGSFLEREVGLLTSRDPLDVEIDGKRIHLVHGDGIAPGDKGYRLLRGLVRWGPTESIFRLIHPDLGIRIAGKVSSLSLNLASHQDVFGAAPYREYAKRKLDEGFNYVIMGHRHVLDQVEHKNGGYYAIGEWMSKGSYAVFDGSSMETKYFIDETIE